MTLIFSTIDDPNLDSYHGKGWQIHDKDLVTISILRGRLVSAEHLINPVTFM